MFFNLTNEKPQRQSWTSLRGIEMLLCEQLLDLFHDLTRSWIPKAIRVNDFSIINVNTELTKAALQNFYFSVIFFSQLGRHPGGHGLLDGSNRTVMYGDFLHGLRSFPETSQPCGAPALSGWRNQQPR
jgi:hypothetical protein